MKKSYILNEGYEGTKIITKSYGSHIFINKKKYIDLSNCAGSQILGHNNKVILNSLSQLNVKKISNYANPNIYALEFSKTLKKIFPEFSKFIFCNSGSEAVMKGLRICRELTGNEIIINVSGSWHGSLNETLYKTNRSLDSIKISDGLPYYSKKNIKFIPYGNILQSEKILKKYKNKICCILMEPVQGALPTIEKIKFIKFLEQYSRKNKILFFLDEIITGLRDKGTSFQNNNNIKSDISVFGKSFGGGFPLGIIGITQKTYNALKKKKSRIFFGGTFSANSINMFIANNITNYLRKNKYILNSIKKNADFFKDGINKFSKNNNLDVRVFSYSSMARVVFTKKQIIDRNQRDFLENQNNNSIKKFRDFIYKKKIFYPSNGIIFFSASLSKKDLKYVINSFQEGLSKYF